MKRWSWIIFQAAAAAAVKIQRELFDFPVFLANLGTSLQPLLHLLGPSSSWSLNSIAQCSCPSMLCAGNCEHLLLLFDLQQLLLLFYISWTCCSSRGASSNIAHYSALLMVMRRIRRCDGKHRSIGDKRTNDSVYYPHPLCYIDNGDQRRVKCQVQSRRICRRRKKSRFLIDLCIRTASSSADACCSGCCH